MDEENFQILSIDATRPVLVGIVASYEAGELTIRHTGLADASIWWDTLVQQKEENYEEDEESGEPAPQKEVVEASPELFRAPLESLLSQLSDEPWEESIIVLPPKQALTVNVELPFSAKKRLQQIAPVETQDRLPFTIEDFHCSPTPIRKLSPSLFDIHVDLFPKDLLENVIGACKLEKLDPAIITIPSGLGELCHTLYPNYIAKNSILVFATPLGYSCSIVVDGVPAGHFLLHGNPYSQNGSRPVSPYVEQSLNVAIAHAERRFDFEIDKIYLIGAQKHFLMWDQSKLIRTTEPIQFADLLPESSDETGFSALAATALQDSRRPELLPNYRSGPFVYRPQVRNLLEGARRISLPVGVFLLALLLALPILYQAREFRMDALEDQLNSTVQAALPNVSIPVGQERAILTREIDNANTILSTIGTSSSIEPQKELALLLEEIEKRKSAGKITLQRIKITPERTNVKGYVTSYQDAEMLESKYLPATSRYCEVKLDASGSRGSSGQQSFELTLKKECKQ